VEAGKAAKAVAFALFDQGKRPSNSEVKALGLKPETTYKYFQEWKKQGEVTLRVQKGSKGSPKGSPAGSRKEPEKVVLEVSFQITFWR